MDDLGGADPADRGPVDWDLAVRIARRGSRPGPTAGRAELSELVAELRELAGVAAEHVARISRLRATGTPDEPGGPAHAVIQVVDRGSWASANVRLLRTLAGPALAAQARTGSGPVRTSLGRATGAAQVGGLLAALSGKVLGQFDPFTADARAPHGRLLLVAPNILGTERSLGVVPRDFRLWVALHEQTHALQFAAAPWLADHLRTRSAELLADLTGRPGAGSDGADGAGGAGGSAGSDDLDGDGLVDTQDPDGATAPGGRPLHEILAAVVRTVVRPGADGAAGGRGVAGLLTSAQRETFDQVSAVMALLEGHADVTMDGVGRTVVPSVRRIRARFEARRDAGASAGGLQRVLREVLGLDAKLAQYRDGAGFVRDVRREVGTEGFNAVWAGPEQLPTAAEIHDAGAWVRRVHG